MALFDVVLLIVDEMNLWKLFQMFNSLTFIHEDIEGLINFERYNILNRNSVLVDRHFQHRFKFFKRNIPHKMKNSRKS